MRSASRPPLSGQPVSISSECLSGVTNSVDCPPSTSTNQIRSLPCSGAFCAARSTGHPAKTARASPALIRLRRVLFDLFLGFAFIAARSPSGIKSPPNIIEPRRGTLANLSPFAPSVPLAVPPPWRWTIRREPYTNVDMIHTDSYRSLFRSPSLQFPVRSLQFLPEDDPSRRTEST